jgi:hypothetical protein
VSGVSGKPLATGRASTGVVDSDKALVTVGSVRAAMYWCGSDGR